MIIIYPRALRYIGVYLPNIRDRTIAKDPNAALVQEGKDTGAEFGGRPNVGRLERSERYQALSKAR